MAEDQKQKRYDLEERTEVFARRVSGFVKKVPKSLSNVEYCVQLIRSSGSVGANYIEANEALSKKDFLDLWFQISNLSRSEHRSERGSRTAGFRISILGFRI